MERGASLTMRERNKIIRNVLVALALVLLLAGIRSSGARDMTAADRQPPASPGPSPPVLALAAPADHPALMDRAEDGAFYPEEALTWGELTRAVGVLVDGLPKPAAAMWLGGGGAEGAYRAQAWLAEAGLPVPDEDGFRPEAAVTREELTALLDQVGLRMEGEEQVLVRAVATAVARGAMLENGQETDGGQAVTRREAAVVLVRLARREPESDRLFDAGLKPVDVDKEDWTWPFMADAALEGPIPQREQGMFRLYGWLYKADENGAIVTDETDGVWTFGPDGRYTTGDAQLDSRLVKALAASGANGLTGQDALKAAYLYVKNNFEYKLAPGDETPEEVGSTGWEYARASRFFRYGGGTCYGYAAAFGLMARALGENAQIVAAEINQFYGDHSFVVIPEDGVDWIYDVELEDARPERHQDLALFHIQNYFIYNYWYIPDW